MTGERYQDLPPAKRRRLIAWAVLRVVLIAAVLVVLYYVLPLDRPWDSDTAVRLLIGLLVVAGVVAGTGGAVTVAATVVVYGLVAEADVPEPPASLTSAIVSTASAPSPWRGQGPSPATLGKVAEGRMGCGRSPRPRAAGEATHFE